jgi:hypothetical protein
MHEIWKNNNVERSWFRTRGKREKGKFSNRNKKKTFPLYLNETSAAAAENEEEMRRRRGKKRRK